MFCRQIKFQGHVSVTRIFSLRGENFFIERGKDTYINNVKVAISHINEWM